MDLVLVVAGALLLIWPIQYRRSIRKVRASIRQRGGDLERFDRTMDRRWIQAGLVVAPLAGAYLVVFGATR